MLCVNRPLVILDSVVSFPTYRSRYVVKAVNLKGYACHNTATGRVSVLGGVMMSDEPVFQVRVCAGRPVMSPHIKM
jgi:hypothetical protein